METEIRVLTEADRPAAGRFLKQQPAGMAMRGYLGKDGVTPNYGSYAGVVEGGEVVSMAAYLGATLHLVAPAQLEALLQLLGKTKQGPLTQINGPTVQVTRTLQWLDAVDSRTFVNSRDELFVLKLSDLQVPPQLSNGALKCRLGTTGDITFQGVWRHDFWVDNLGAPPGPRLLENCTKLVEQEVAEKLLYVLEDAGRPVCTSAFGPALPDAVQVVNVFTPPAERGRGYARALTAATLLDARSRGVEEGILYTALTNTIAQRTYRGLGFVPVDRVTMLVFAEPRSNVPGA
ncbi:MAG TPA: GNAT family N-acetyltransferase [Myxococcaceae bacterium]|jgi:ribosomal protein S18 acetylase RimI-like enzyme